MTVEMDTDGFYSALMRSVDNRQASRWQLHQQTGVSVTTLVRLGQGVRPDAASYAAHAGERENATRPWLDHWRGGMEATRSW